MTTYFFSGDEAHQESFGNGSGTMSGNGYCLLGDFDGGNDDVEEDWYGDGDHHGDYYGDGESHGNMNEL